MVRATTAVTVCLKCLQYFASPSSSRLPAPHHHHRRRFSTMGGSLDFLTSFGPTLDPPGGMSGFLDIAWTHLGPTIIILNIIAGCRSWLKSCSVMRSQIAPSCKHNSNPLKILRVNLSTSHIQQSLLETSWLSHIAILLPISEFFFSHC